MKTIMVVDDEEDTRLTVKSVLGDEGFKTVSAVNGQDCLNKLKKVKPDLILLDVMMPGLTSKEIITAIRKNKKTAKVKVIFLTVVRFAEMTQKGLMGGNVVDFIEKPFDTPNLIKRIKKALKIK
jgi:CheY-like chemotaxis protein